MNNTTAPTTKRTHNRPTEILDVMPLVDGTSVPVVEMKLAVDGMWNCLSNRGYVYCIAQPRFVTVVQGPSVVINGIERRQRWTTVEENGDMATHHDTLEAACAAAASIANPLGARGWQWSGGRPIDSLAEADRNMAGAANFAANAEAARRGR
jgi:hypothetical protein